MRPTAQQNRQHSEFEAFSLLLALCAPVRGLKLQPGSHPQPGSKLQTCRHQQPTSPLAARVDSFNSCVLRTLPDIIELARKHRVSGLLYTALAAIPEVTDACARTPAFRSLEKDRHAGLVFRNFSFSELARITTHLDARGISVLPVKGLSLSMQLYGNPLTREFRDLDMLCRVDDLLVLISPMEELGYVCVHFDKDLERKDPGMQLSVLHHLVMEHPVMKLSVELHKGLFKEGIDIRAPALPELFSRHCLLNWNGITWQTLDPADQAAYMLYHGAGHAWSLLHWLLDTAVLLSGNTPLDLVSVAGRIREYGLETTLAAALGICSRFFDFDIPSAFSQAATARSFRSIRPYRFVQRYLPAGTVPAGNFLYLCRLNFGFFPTLEPNPHPVRSVLSRFLRHWRVQSRIAHIPGPLFPFFVVFKIAGFFGKPLYRRIAACRRSSRA